MSPTVINLPFHFDSPLPSQFQNDDNRYPKNLVEYFISKFTKINDIVFDPFTGYGTTLFVGKELGRNVIGTEIDKAKVDYLSTKLTINEEIFLGDVRQRISDLPEIDFVMTSPPYSSRYENLNPFTNYKKSGNYEQYLLDIVEIFRSIKMKMKSNSHIVIEVANLKNKGEVTTLAWDICKVLSSLFEFEGEIIVNWECENKPNGTYGYGYDHSYCLIFLTS